jgi:hypothetical protein
MIFLVMSKPEMLSRPAKAPDPIRRLHEKSRVDNSIQVSY